MRSFEIRFEFKSAVPIPFDSTVMGQFENFRIGRVCPLLVVVRRLKPLTALSGTVYELASSMNDHTPVLFNVFENFENWNLWVFSVLYILITSHNLWHNYHPKCTPSFSTLVGLTHEMSYTADSIRDSIRIVTPGSIRIRFKRKRPIRRSLQNHCCRFAAKPSGQKILINCCTVGA